MDHHCDPSPESASLDPGNVLLVIFVGVLFLGYRRLALSTTSYFLLAAFIILHIVGAHYTYARMPLGLWAKDYFGLSRNHYDRFAHGAFGFLLAFPVRELLLRFSGESIAGGASG
jgi:Predicted membrane protein